MKFKVEKFVLGKLQSNFYVVTDVETGESAAIDPGYSATALFESLGTKNIKYILLTHAHFDHVLGAEELKRFVNAPIALSSTDAAILDEKITPDILLENGDTLAFGSGSIRIIGTPGHTAGSLCFIVGDLLFSGDTMFRGTIGRCDFPTGSYDAMLKSIEKLRGFSDNYRVLPGHGEETTINAERRDNNFFKIG